MAKNISTTTTPARMKAAVETATKPKRAANKKAPTADTKEAKPRLPALPLLVPTSKALATDIGPIILAQFQAGLEAESEKRRYQQLEAKNKNEAAARLTLALLNASKVDPKFRLEVYTGDDNRTIQQMNDYARIVVGVSEIVDGKIITTAAASPYFTPTGDEAKRLGKDSPEFKKRVANAKNFSTSVKKAALSALGLSDLNAKVRFSEEASTLQIEGPKVKERFGLTKVTIDDAKKEGMKEKPSLTVLRDIAASKRGGSTSWGKQGRVQSTQSTTSVEAFGQICNTLIEAIAKLGVQITDEHKRHLRPVVSASAKALGLTVS
jgi:hypothetical protein